MVHSDLKPENIMLIQDDDNNLDFKIIDLGSSFSFNKTTESIELTTPEYLPPDILEFLDNKTSFLM